MIALLAEGRVSMVSRVAWRGQGFALEGGGCTGRTQASYMVSARWSFVCWGLAQRGSVLETGRGGDCT